MERPDNVSMRVTGDKSVPIVWEGGVTKDFDWENLLLTIGTPYTKKKLEPASHIRGKEFYGKAVVYEYADQFVKTKVCMSYETNVAIHVEDLSLGLQYLRVHGHSWSNTTVRHLQSFIELVDMTPHVDHVMTWGVPDEHTKVKKFKGGYANRLLQTGDIVIAKDSNILLYEAWYENMPIKG
jgi:hypothetical protein